MKALAMALLAALGLHEAERVSGGGRAVARQLGRGAETRLVVERDGQTAWALEPGYALAAFEVSDGGVVVGVRQTGQPALRGYYAKVFGVQGELRLDERFLVQDEAPDRGPSLCDFPSGDESLSRASTYIGVEIHDALSRAVIRRDLWEERELREFRREVWLSFDLSAVRLPEPLDVAGWLDRVHPLPDGERLYVLEGPPIPGTNVYVLRSLVGRSIDAIEGEVADVVRADGVHLGTVRAPAAAWTAASGVCHSVTNWDDTERWRLEEDRCRLELFERSFTLRWAGSAETARVVILPPRWPLPVEQLAVR